MTRTDVEKYRGRSIHYLENALQAIDLGEGEKAGDFLWGGFAQALKAVAAGNNIQLRKHWDIADYARDVAKALNDKSIYDVYGHASYLHSNFYEAGLRKEDLEIYAEEIRAMVGRLLKLIPPDKPKEDD